MTSSLLVIGICLLASVILIDIVVRCVIVCGVRKRKRAVKPLVVMEPNLHGLRVPVEIANNVARAPINNQDSIVEEENVENQSIPSV